MSVIDRLAKVKAVVIRYNLFTSHKTEEIFSLMAHYCAGPDRNNTHIGMPSTTATDGVYLYNYVMKVVDNSGFEAKIVRIASDGGGNLWFCMESQKSKYINDSVFHHPIPFSPWSALHIYWQGIARWEFNRSSQIVVNLELNLQGIICRSAIVQVPD